MYLLDVNVLIAIVDAGHGAHRNAVEWFRGHMHAGWATCPITENALIRILSQPSYANRRDAAVVRDLLRQLKRLPGHVFIPNDLSLTDPGIFTDWSKITPKRLTDAYLLALAVRHGAKLATFGSRIDATLVTGGVQSLLQVRADG